MSRPFSGNEKCVFCGWTRRNAYQSVRFFCIPKDPGLKRVRWLQVFGDREISAKDRVCSVHFRQGRPSSDPSHEDFVPHLYLNNEPPPEVLDYLESLADSKPEKVANNNAQLNKTPPNVSANTSTTLARKISPVRSSKPSILKRKRRPKQEPMEDEEMAEHLEPHDNMEEEELEPRISPPRVLTAEVERGDEQRTVKLTLVQRQIADVLDLKPGQTVIFRKRLTQK